MKDHREDFRIDSPTYHEEDLLKIKGLYSKYFGKETSDENARDLYKMYNWSCSNLKAKLASVKIHSEKKDEQGRRLLFFEDFKCCIYTEYQDLEDYIKSEKEDYDRRIEEHKAHQEYMKLPWWQRELGSKGQDPYWQDVAKSFLDSDEYHDLCQYWDFSTAEINKIALWYKSKYLHVYTFDLEELMKDPCVKGFCVGICADGGRVFRTAVSVFHYMHHKYGIPFFVGKVVKKD